MTGRLNDCQKALAVLIAKIEEAGEEEIFKLLIPASQVNSLLDSSKSHLDILREISTDVQGVNIKAISDQGSDDIIIELSGRQKSMHEAASRLIYKLENLKKPVRSPVYEKERERDYSREREREYRERDRFDRPERERERSDRDRERERSDRDRDRERSDRFERSERSERGERGERSDRDRSERDYEREKRRYHSPRRHDSPPRSKASINVAVPDDFVARLIGRNGENVKNIMNATNCNISFQKPVIVMQSSADLRTPDNARARMCTFRGSPSSISEGLKMLLDQIIKLERHES